MVLRLLLSLVMLVLSWAAAAQDNTYVDRSAIRIPVKNAVIVYLSNTIIDTHLLRADNIIGPISSTTADVHFNNIYGNNFFGGAFYGDGSGLTNIPPPSSTPWASLTGVPSQLQDVSNGLIISTTLGYFGTVSATSYYGDGSHLTGVTPLSIGWASITSIPAGVQNVANASGSVTATTFTGGLVSATTTSGTFGYFKNISGTTAALGSLTVNGVSITGAAPDWYSLTNIPSQVQQVSSSGSITMAQVSATRLYGGLISTTALTANTAGSQGSYVVVGPYVSTLGGDNAAQFNIPMTVSSGIALNRMGAAAGITGGVAEYGAGANASGGEWANSFFFNTKNNYTAYKWLNNGSLLMTISPSGNVGIGTSNQPNSKLEVAGNISATNVYVTGTTGTVSATYGYFKNVSATLSGNGAGVTNVTASSMPYSGLTAVPAQVAAVSNATSITMQGLQAGIVTATTYISSVTYYGDGSHLTGISGGASPTWGSITGIPAGVQNISNSTGSITVTTVTAGLVSTSTLSATTASVTTLLVNNATCTGTCTGFATGGSSAWTSLTGVPSGVANVSNSIGSVTATIFSGDTSGTHAYARYASFTTVTAPSVITQSPLLVGSGTYYNDGLQSSGNYTFIGNGALVWKPAGSETGYATGSQFTFEQPVSIGANFNPTTALEVRGIISGTGVTTGIVTASTYVSAPTYYGDGSNLTGIAGGASPSWAGISGIPVGVQNVSNAAGSVTATIFSGNVSGTNVYATNLSATNVAGSGAGLINLPVYESVSLTLSTRQTNFTVAGMSSATQVVTEARLTPTSSSVIAGINADGIADGKQLIVRNVTSPTGPNARMLVLEREAPGATYPIGYAPMAVPMVLMPQDEVRLRWSATDARWNFIEGNRHANVGNMLDEFNEYIVGLSACMTTGTAATCGRDSSTFSYNANQYGIGSAFPNTGSTSSGRSYLGGEATDFGLGNGAALFVTRAAPENLATAAQNFKAFYGFHNGNAAAMPTNGVMYAYDVSATGIGNNTMRIAAFAGGSSTSSTVTGLTVTTANPIGFLVFVNGNSTVAEYMHFISQTVVYDGSINTNVPSGTSQLLGVEVGLTKNTGSTSRELNVDYMGFRYQVPRGQ